MPPNFIETTFANSHKTVKFVEVSPSKVSRYMVHVFPFLLPPLPHQTHLCLCQEVSLSAIVSVLVQPELHQHLLTTQQSHDIHMRVT